MALQGDVVKTLRRQVAGVEVAAVTGGTVPEVEGTPGGGIAALRISPDAVALLQWLEGAENTEAALPGGRALLLELGSGHGFVGLACAAARPEASVVLTDVPELLAHAERSVAANTEELAARALVRPLAFGDAAALETLLAELGHGCEADESATPSRLPRSLVALGAGIFYWECVFQPLADTLAQLCRVGGTAVLGYFRRDWKVERRFWTKLLPQLGLRVDVLWEGEVEEPKDKGAYAPACTRTPGEWNARVYHVTLAEGSVAAQDQLRGGVVAGTPEGNPQEADESKPWLQYGGGPAGKKGGGAGKKSKK